MSMRKVFSVAAAVAVASSSGTDAVLLRRAHVQPVDNPTRPGTDHADPAEVQLSMVPAKNPEAIDVDAPESSGKPRKSKKNRRSKKDVPARRAWWKSPLHALGTVAIGGGLTGGGYAWGKASCPDIPSPVTSTTGAPTFKPSSAPTFSGAADLYDTSLLNSTLYSKFGPGETPASVFGFNPELAPGEKAGCNQYEKTCKGVFTYNNYLNAFNTEFPTFKSEADAIATFGGGVANMMAETGNGQSCGENVQEPDGNGDFFCPTKDGHGCSAGKRPDYSKGQHKGPDAVGYGPIRAKMQPTEQNPNAPGFTQTTCNGKDRPTNGCVVWKDSPHEKKLTGEDAKECYSGQGAFMTTWAANFEKADKDLKAAGYTDIDLCEDPKAVCQDGKTANAVGMQYWKNKAMKFFETDKGLDFSNAVKKGIAPEDIRNIPKRVQDYKKILERYNVPFTVDGETVEDYYGQEVRYENIIVQSGGEATSSPSAAATPSPASSTAAAASDCYATGQGCKTAAGDCSAFDAIIDGQVVKSQAMLDIPGAETGCACTEPEAESAALRGANNAWANAKKHPTYRCGAQDGRNGENMKIFGQMGPNGNECRFGDASAPEGAWANANAHPENTC